jgi:uncharacterized membrane protein YczE
LFLLLLVAVSLFYGYQDILFFPPQSVHVWRQCDCTSMALMYAEHGMHFFEPEMHNLHADGQTTGYAVGEFPIIYYFVAIVYKLFGQHDFLFRATNLLIFFAGLFFMFKLIYLVSKDYFYAMLFPLLLFTSPLLVYYANNFLPEVPSLGLTLIGWYFFFKMRQQYRPRYLYLSIFFFTLGTLIKVSSGISMILVFGLLFLESTNLITLKKDSKIFRQSLAAYLGFMSGFMLIIAWYLFAIKYNQDHSTYYFRTGIIGFWETKAEDAIMVSKMFFNNWKFFIFNDSVYFLLGIFLLMAFFISKNKLLILINLLAILGIAIFISLWYGLLHQHDYYFAPLLIVAALLFISFSETGNIRFPKTFHHPALKIAFSVLLIVNVVYATNKVKRRYTGYSDHQNRVELYEIQNYLDLLHIEKDAKIICTPDPSPNHMLYLLNRQGWSDLYGMNSDSLKIAGHIRQGAKYLFVYDSIPRENKELNYFMDKLIGEKGVLRVYRLKTPGQSANKE